MYGDLNVVEVGSAKEASRPHSWECSERTFVWVAHPPPRFYRSPARRSGDPACRSRATAWRRVPRGTMVTVATSFSWVVPAQLGRTRGGLGLQIDAHQGRTALRRKVVNFTPPLEVVSAHHHGSREVANTRAELSTSLVRPLPVPRPRPPCNGIATATAPQIPETREGARARLKSSWERLRIRRADAPSAVRMGSSTNAFGRRRCSEQIDPRRKVKCGCATHSNTARLLLSGVPSS